MEDDSYPWGDAPRFQFVPSTFETQPTRRGLSQVYGASHRTVAERTYHVYEPNSDGIFSYVYQVEIVTY